MAAALFESLLINHAFVDGNKPIAFFATDVFLRLNGWKLVVSPDDGEKFIIDVLSDKSRSLGKIVTWIRQHIESV